MNCTYTLLVAVSLLLTPAPFTPLVFSLWVSHACHDYLRRDTERPATTTHTQEPTERD